MTATTPKPRGLLQAKWELIGQALTAPALSSGDCAVLWSICERYNEETGAAWPSLNRLATDTGRNRATIQRSIARLVKAGWLTILEHGSRANVSNRYRPEFERPKVGASTHLAVGASTHEGGCISVLDVGASTHPESIYEPGYEAGVNRWDPAAAGAASGGGAGAAPGGLPVPPSAGRKYPEFWAAYPRATGVFKAEQTIDALIAAGEVTLPELVSRARAFAEWVKAQPWQDKDKYTKGAVNWLAERRWLDDYTVRSKQDKAQRDRPAKAHSAPVAASGQTAKVSPRAEPKPTGAENPMLELLRHGAWWVERNANARRAEKDAWSQELKSLFPRHAPAILDRGVVDLPALTEVEYRQISSLLDKHVTAIKARIAQGARANKQRREAGLPDARFKDRRFQIASASATQQS